MLPSEPPEGRPCDRASAPRVSRGVASTVPCCRSAGAGKDPRRVLPYDGRARRSEAGRVRRPGRRLPVGRAPDVRGRRRGGQSPRCREADTCDGDAPRLGVARAASGGSAQKWIHGVSAEGLAGLPMTTSPRPSGCGSSGLCKLRVLVALCSRWARVLQRTEYDSENVVVTATRVRIPLGPPLLNCWIFRPRV